jgi:pSer/pThr/pTyr-binding forkhead associated (FHA) protein
MSFLLIKIGQNDENDVVLKDPSIAPEHAEIFVDVEGNVFLTDLGTGKDTFVNGHKLLDSIELKSMDKVTCGDGIELDWKTVLEINQPKTITVGRGKSNDYVIDAPSVSENHLQLIQDQNDSYFLSDLESEQGTYVNGNRISEIALLKAGDVVHVGDELFLWKSIFSNSEKPLESDEAVEFVELKGSETESDAASDSESKLDVVEENTETPIEQLEINFDPKVEAATEEIKATELNQELVESEDEKEHQNDSFVEIPELKESLVINPEPIDFIVESEVVVPLESKKSKVNLDESKVNEAEIQTDSANQQSIDKQVKTFNKAEDAIDSSVSNLAIAAAETRKKELLQLGIIVAADILLVILISAMI